MSAEQQLAILPAKEVALAVFSAPNGLDPYLQSVREEIDKFNASAPDVKTKKGQAAYRSIAYSLAGSKTKLDDLGKELVAELKDIPKKIDDERRHQQALEQAEVDRAAAVRLAEQERIDSERRQAEAAERARLAEIARANAAADEINRQAAAREADKAHKAKINRAALDAFIAGGMTEECAKQAITLIAQRKIPAVSITY